MRTIETIEQYSGTLFGRIIGYLQARRKTDPRPRNEATAGRNIDWPVERPDYGGYNEAYVMHHWASFSPNDREPR